jgi:oxalate decarboxylase
MKFQFSLGTFLISTAARRAAGLASPGRRALSKGTHLFHAEISRQACKPYTAANGSCIKVIDKSAIAMPAGAKVQMQFEEIHTAPGDIREVHWHLNSGEWAYVKKGTCEFTLIDSEGRYDQNTATVGDVWYFPKGWQHYFQGVDPDVGCTGLFWFGTSYANIDLTHTLAELPPDIVSASLGGMSEDLAKDLTYPLYDPEDEEVPPFGIHQRKLSDTAEEAGKGDKGRPRHGTLKQWPVFPMKEGKLNVASGGVEYQIKNDVFPATLTMSGGLLELEEGAIGEIYWHPDSEEQHYVLEGKVEVTVYGIDQDTRYNVLETFTLSKGDVGIVPINYIHYIKAVGGPAKLVLHANLLVGKAKRCLRLCLPF